MDVEHRLLAQLGGYGLEGCTEVDGLSVADAALDAARAVGEGDDGAVGGSGEGVVLLGASLADAIEAASVVESLAGIDAEHGVAQGCMEFAEHGLAQAYGTALDDAGDDASDGVAIGLDGEDELLHLLCLGHVGTAHDVGLGEREVVAGVVVVEGYVSHL